MCDICVGIAKQLFHSELKYADVIASFRNLSNEKREEVTSKHGSFVDWITSTCNMLDNKDSVEFTYLVHKVVRDKISLGLTAMGSLKIAEIQSNLMHTSGFVSDSLLKRIINEFPEFQITQDGPHEVVKLHHCVSPTKKISISLPDIKTSKCADPQDKSNLIKALFRDHPDVVACLGKHVTWDLINKSYHFWKVHCGHSTANFTDWLTSMSNYHSPALYPEYLKALRLCFLKQCMNFIQGKARTIREIRDNLSLSKGDLTSDNFVYEACEESSQLIVSKPVDNTDVSQYVVNIVGRETKPIVKTTISMKTSCSNENVSTPSVESPIKPRFPIFLPAGFAKKIMPLLTYKVSYSSLVSTYHDLFTENTRVMNEVLSKFDCFLDFLQQFGKHIRKVMKSDMYEDALVNQVKIMICQKLYSVESHTLPWSELVESLAPKGFADLKFIYKTLQSNASRFALVDSNVTMIDEKRLKVLKDSDISYTSLLSHPPLQNLCSVDTKFIDLFRTYHTLSADAKKCLAANHKTFVYLVEEFFKLRHPNKYYFYRKHLNTLIFSELFDLVHSRQTINVTLAHRIVSRGNFEFISCDEILASMRVMPSKIRVVENLFVLCSEGRTQYQGGIGMESTAMEHIAQAVRDIFTTQKTSDGRLAGLLALDDALHENVRSFITSRFSTLCHLINCSSDGRSIFRDSVERKVAEYLDGRTMFVDELLRNLFGQRTSFMNKSDLLDMLSPEKFVVLHHPTGTIVSEVRSSLQGKVRYLDESEKMIVETVLSFFMRKGCTQPFDFIYNRVCSSQRFTKCQRLFLFGKPEGELANHLSEVYFRRFLLIFPTIFTMRESDEVVIAGQTSPSPRRRSRSRSSSSNGDLEKSIQKSCDSERESGEVTDEEDTKKSVSKRHSRKRSCGKKDDARQKKKKRKRKAHSKTREDAAKSTNQPEPGSLHDTILSLPNNLVQDVTMGRLLASQGNQMPLKALMDCLMSSLLNEAQRVQITEEENLQTVFQSKILESLTTADQVQVLDLPDENSQTVRLILKQLQKLENNMESSVAVYRHVASLTGVTNKELTTFIKALLSIQGGELDVGTVVNVSRQKYNKRKTFPNLPDDVIACQVISCLRQSSALSVDAVKATCCIREEQGHSQNLAELSNCLENVRDEEVTNFVAGYLNEETRVCGTTVNNLLAEVSSHFHTRMGSVLPSTLELVVQGLIPGLETVGFTAAGKVAKLRGNVPDRDDAKSLTHSDNDQKPNEEIEQAFATPSVETVEEITICVEDSDVIRLDAQDESATRQNVDAPCDKVASNIADGGTDVSDVSSSSKQKASNETSDALKEENESKCLIKGPSPPAQQDIVSCSRETVQEARRAKRVARHERIFAFLVAFLSHRNFCSETVDVLMAAGREFASERFARSPLAMEAYMREFVAFSGDLFAFGNRYGDVGVTWIFYRPHCAQNAITSKPALPLLEVMKDLVEAVQVHLLTKPNRKDSLAELCSMAACRFASNLAVIQECERLPTCRTLVLIGCIRNLDKFIFSKSEMTIGLRRETLSKTIQLLTTPLTPLSPARRPSSEETKRSPPVPTPIPLRAKTKSKAAQRNEAAIKLVAEILHSHGPCTKTELRDLWSREAPDDVRKVLGTGVSFLFDLRKFEQYFPTSDDGKVELNDIEFQRFLLQI